MDRYARHTKVATTVVVALILGVAGCGAPESSFGREATVVAVITRRARGRAFGLSVQKGHPAGLHRQTSPVSHSPQLLAAPTRPRDQFPDDIPGERIAVYPDGEQLLGLAQRHHSVVTAAR